MKIERKIPIPPDTHAPKYPWLEMKVGDSFLMLAGTVNPHSRAGYASVRYAPRKWLVRKTSKGYRCWRIK